MTCPVDLVAAMRDWRHDLHAHPEFGFEEQRTARKIAEILRGFGLAVTEGVGGTGVVGTLRRGRSERVIALRADMDALRITEAAAHAWASTHPGLMHACGHDGHVAMLLGAAGWLARDGGFDGTVHFVFQPAEEWGRGAEAMLADGLIERFDLSEIYGLHNLPGHPVGHVTLAAGPVMSAEDNFEIVLEGLGGHAARPQDTREVMVAACQLVLALQGIVSRRVDPAEIAVVSVTEIVTDGTRNALPGRAVIKGDARSFKPAISALIETEMLAIAEGIAKAHHLSARLIYSREFVPLINDAVLVEEVRAAAMAALGAARVTTMPGPFTASEDFARFLAHRPGVFAFLGNGEASAPLHNPGYDFNDDALAAGAALHVAIVRRRLPQTMA